MILNILGPLIAYGGLVCWLTWPLAASAAAFLPFRGLCESDNLYSAWVLAHGSHALATAPATFPHANIYHPTPGALFYGPAGLGALWMFAPVFLASGNAALALNVTFLLGLVLTATTMHIVVRRWTGSDLAGLVGATTLLLNQWILWEFVPRTPHWAALCLFPVIAFTAAKPLDSLRSSLRLLPLVVLQCLTDLAYTTPAVLTPLGVLALLRIARRRSRAAGVRLAAVLALAVLVLLPVYVGYLTVRAANPALAQQTAWRMSEITFATPLFDHVLAGPYPFVVTSVAAGLIAVGLLASVWRRRQGAAPPVPGGWAHGALWTIVGGCLAQMPRVVIAGERWTTPLWYLDQWLHFYRIIRVPSRLGIAGLVGLGILSGVAFAEVAEVVRARLRRPAAALVARMALAAIVVSLVYRAYATNNVLMGQERGIPAAYPVQKAPTIPSGILEVLRSSPEPLLELPLGPGAIAYCDHALAMYHSIAHWRPLLNGYSSYWPEGFPERMALAKRLPDQDALDDLVKTTGLSMVWLHTQRLTPAQRLAWMAPRGAGGGHAGLVLVKREGPEWLYAVVPPTAAAPAS